MVLTEDETFQQVIELMFQKFLSYCWGNTITPNQQPLRTRSTTSELFQVGTPRIEYSFPGPDCMLPHVKQTNQLIH